MRIAVKCCCCFGRRRCWLLRLLSESRREKAAAPRLQPKKALRPPSVSTLLSYTQSFILEVMMTTLFYCNTAARPSSPAFNNGRPYRPNHLACTHSSSLVPCLPISASRLPSLRMPPHSPPCDCGILLPLPYPLLSLVYLAPCPQRCTPLPRQRSSP